MQKATRCILCILLAVLCVLPLYGCRRGSDVPLSAGLSMIEGVPIYNDDVAMSTEHFTITPGMMAYFFYTCGGTMMDEMEAQRPFDSTKTLHGQMFTETLTWYDVIMNATLVQVSQLLIYCEAAHAEGQVLDDASRVRVEAVVANYRTQAAANYGLSMEEYLQAMYGPLMSEQDLRAVLELETLANSYSLSVTAALEEGISKDAIRDTVREQGLTDETPSRNVSFLYIPYGEDGKPNEEKAAPAYEKLLASPSTATLSGLKSSGTVGKEEHLTPESSGIEAIAEWLFDAEREVLDVGRVETAGATYLLLYTGNGMTYAEVKARMLLFDAAYADWYNSWVEQLTFGYNYDCLDGYDIEK